VTLPAHKCGNHKTAIRFPAPDVAVIANRFRESWEFGVGQNTTPPHSANKQISKRLNFVGDIRGALTATMLAEGRNHYLVRGRSAELKRPPSRTVLIASIKSEPIRDLKM